MKSDHHNLPIPAEPTIERAARADVVELLARPQSVVRGAPGIGKTTLVVDAAAALLNASELDEVWFVDLATVATVEGAIHGLGIACGIRRSGRSVLEDLDHLARSLARRGRVLLIWDNCEENEQVLGTLGARFAALDDVRTVATSRTVVWSHVQQYECPPMTLEEGEAMIAERMSRLRPNRPLTDEDRAVARSIVAAVDGLPIAVEAAAAQTLVLELAEVLGRLHRPGEDALHAAFMAPWAALSETERRAARICATFTSGFRASTFEAIWDPPQQAISVLSSLRKASLLSARESAHGPRLRVLRPVADFVAAAEVRDDDVDLRVVDHFAQFASDRMPEVARDSTALSELSLELDNLLLAYRTAIRHGRAGLAAQLFLGCHEVLWAQGASRAIVLLGREWVGHFEAVTDADAVRVRLRLGAAHALCGAHDRARAEVDRALEDAAPLGPLLQSEAAFRDGWLRWFSGDAATGLQHLDRAIELAREAEDEVEEARAVAAKATVMTSQGAPLQEVEPLFERAIEVQHRRGNLRDEARALSGLATSLANHGRPQRAREFEQRALELLLELGDGATAAKARFDLASYSLDAGDLDAADREAADAADHAQRFGMAPIELFAVRLRCVVAALAGRWGAFDEHVAALTKLRTWWKHPTADASVDLIVAIGAWIRGDEDEAAGRTADALRAMGRGYERTHQIAAVALDVLLAIDSPVDRLDELAADLSPQSWASALVDLVRARVALGDDSVDSWNAWHEALRRVSAAARTSYWVRLFLDGIRRTDPTPLSRLVVEVTDDTLIVVEAAGRIRPPGKGWVDLSGRAQLLTLLDALIARRDEGLTRDEVQAALWPGEIIEHGAAKARVQTAVSMLRKTGVPVELDKEHYRLPRDLDVVFSAF